MASSGGLPNIGIEPKSFMSPALAGGSLPLEPTGKPDGPFLYLFLVNYLFVAFACYL